MGFSFLNSKTIRITPVQSIYLLILIALTSLAISSGIKLRVDAFNWSASIHHEDVYGANRRGQIISQVGIFEIYDELAKPNSEYISAGIDYAPLRVLAIGRWTQWFKTNHPGQRWTDTYDFTWPLLTMNTIAELLSAILVFLLIFHWINRSRPGDATWTFGINTALIGATLFWFNPALIWNAHCWPQWDVWLVPFFLLAVFLTSKNCWFSAGISIAIGTFFKGQILLVAPVLVLWPLFQSRWKESIRLLSGFALGCLIIAYPWMGLTTRQSSGMMVLFAIITIFNACFCPKSFSKSDWVSYNTLLFSIASFCALIYLGASMNWYTVGFEFGTHKFPNLASANGTYSLPTLLRDYFQYPDDMNTPIELAGFSISVRHLSFGLYGICLLVCSIAAARLDRKNSAAFLLTVVTPWICFFMLLTQMNNRYLVWGAMFSASMLVATHRGLTLLGIILSLICVAGMSHHMLPSDPQFAPQAYQMVMAMRTHLAWPVAIIGLVFLYETIAACDFWGKNRELVKPS